jgi:hypothetical protein
VEFLHHVLSELASDTIKLYMYKSDSQMPTTIEVEYEDFQSKV